MSGTAARLPGIRKRQAAMLLAGAAMAALAGCGKMDHRISLEEFQALAARAEAERAYVPQWKELADNAVIDQRLSGYRLGPDDVVAVIVRTTSEQHAVPPAQARVNDQGQIDLVMVGRLDVNDLTIQETETAIREAYVPRYFREASVLVTTSRARPKSSSFTRSAPCSLRSRNTLPGLMSRCTRPCSCTKPSPSSNSSR
mgnify:CR=1 FL=1